MKTIVKIAGAVLLGICMTEVVCAEENSVSVIGKGEVKLKPDVAFVTLYVKGDAVAMVDAAKQVNDKVEEVKTALKNYKQIKDIEINDAAIGEFQRRVYMSSDDKEEGQHPEIIRRLRITMSPNPAKVYQVIDTAISAGAVMQIPSPITYPSEDKTLVVYGLLKSADAEAQSRQTALADAKKQAETLAALAGKKVGGVMKIASDGLPPESKFIARIVGRESDLPTAYIGHNSKEITVGSSLNVVFELKSP